MSKKQTVIHSSCDPYRDTVQCLVNQPPAVVKLLATACDILGRRIDLPRQAEVYDRLTANAPRVAIISGSADHVAHLTDNLTMARAALAVWNSGGVPFSFGIPVVCDGTAQGHLGMSYSLFSRNLAAESVANQMEAHAYHAAIVLQGCDKTPFGIACGLAAVDLARRRRGDAPLWATFVPAHVMKGGGLSPATRKTLDALAERAERARLKDVAEDLRATMEYVVQCTSNEAYDGVLQRLHTAGVLSTKKRTELKRQLATCACGPDGGICAFNGTGNSSRVAVAALGLTHPSVEWLTKPPNAERVEKVVADLFRTFNKTEYSVSQIVRDNWANAVRVHSATGGSTNLVLHMIALANYAGKITTVETYDRVRRKVRVPDIFDFSLTEDRTHYELARQCEASRIRGMETIYHELTRQNVPMNLDAPTVAGKTWAARLKRKKGLSADGVKRGRIILSQPRRLVSGVDVLTGNFFDSAVVKISGMTDTQLDEFDDKLHVVLYMNNEEEAAEAFLNETFFDKLYRKARLTKKMLRAILEYNAPDLACVSAEDLYETMIETGAIKIAVVIAGQGPKAFGMPEMFIPMQHINSNRRLRKITTLISDGRFSGVSYGAAIGHLTPESADRGGIIYLKNGDLLRLCLKKRTLDLIAFEKGTVKKQNQMKTAGRKTLAGRRLKEIAKRRDQIAALCIQNVTDAATGLVPCRVLNNSKEKTR